MYAESMMNENFKSMKNKILVLIMLFIGLESWAQSSGLKGRVMDRYGRPVVGALVKVRGTGDSMAFTDKQGNFEIAAQPGMIVVFSSENYPEKEITVGNEDKLNVVMDYGDEVIRLGNDLKQTRAEVTGAVSTVSSQQLMKSSALSLSNALYGNVLGLTALQNGDTEWNDNATFYIRGLQTLSDNSILVVVDGFERSLNNLALDEIEDVQVLKDAAAVALYGFRGINGVISVTTKRGKYSSMKVDFHYDHGFRKPIGLPANSDAYTYALAMNEAAENDGLARKYSDFELDAFRNGTYSAFYPNINWKDEIMRDLASSNIYNINIYGGGQKARYFTMVNLETSRGFFKNTESFDDYSSQNKLSRFNVRTNVDVDLSASTALQVNIRGTLQEVNYPGTSISNLMNAIYTLPAAAFPIRALNGDWGGNSVYGSNPVAMLRASGYAKQQTRTLSADVKLGQKLDFITKGLSASVRFAYDNTAVYQDSYTRTFKYTEDRLIFENDIPVDYTSTSQGETGKANFSTSLYSQSRQLGVVAKIDYDRSFDKHKVFASLQYLHDHPVYNDQHQSYFRENASAYLHYGYDNRYFLDGVLVASASNRLASDNRWAYAPTFSAAWMLSNEDFLKNAAFVDFLKLRASFGMIHTDYVPSAGFWLPSYGSGNGYHWNSGSGEPGSSSGISEGRLPSFGAKTEKANKLNVGIDFAFLKRFNFTAEAFFDRRKNILLTGGGKTSSVLGTATPFENAGIVDNKGIELGLDYNDRAGDFSWNVGGKFTYYRSKIVEEYETVQPYDYLKATGKPVGQLFGYEVLGFYQDQADIDGSPINQLGEVKPGDFKYKDRNGDGYINQYDVVPMGYNGSCPEIYYSFNLGFEWKGLGVSALFQGAAHYSVVLGVAGRDIPLIGNTTITDRYYNNRWTPGNPEAKYPRLTTMTNANNFTNNSTWLTDASFLKLRNCEIYYNLPQHWLSKVRMSSAKVYARGMNLFSVDGVDVSDPEVPYISYPLAKSWHIGVSFGF